MFNDLENFKATTAHRKPERMLYYASFTPDLLRRVKAHIGGKNMDAHYGFARRQTLAMRRPENLAPLDYSPYYGKDELPEGTKFNAHGAAQVPAGFYHFLVMFRPYAMPKV